MGVMIPATNWFEWDGNGFDREFTNSVVYYTYGEVDIENDTFMLRALARTLKEDGVVDSVSEGIDSLESAFVTAGNLLEIDDERFPVYSDGEEFDDDAPVFAATWVEVNLDD